MPPSQILGHLQYVKGAASETIGNLASSPAWQTSGRTAQKAGLEEMRAAKQESDQKMDLEARNKSVLGVEGRAQGVAGGLTGCTGMMERGESKVKHAAKSKD